MKKVLHVIDALNVGGAQELLALMAKHKGDAFAMSVCVLQPVLDLKSKIESHGVTVHALNRTRCSIKQPLGFLRYSLGNLFDIMRICRDEHIDILHAHLSDTEFLGFFATLLGCAHHFYTTVHTPKLLPENRERGLRGMARNLLMRLIYNHAKKVIAVSRDTATLLRAQSSIDPAKLLTIANGVETRTLPGHRPALGREALGLADNNLVLLCVGRLTRAKGHIYLLEAVRLLAPQVPGLRLLMAGDGELREKLTRLAEDMDVSTHVRFLGSRKDIPDLLALSDIYVSASVFEGTSLAVMEAMAAGKPIVATEIPGNTELLEHGVNALLTPPADAPLLARAIARIAQDAELAAELGRRAQEKAQSEFDIMAVIRKYTEAWGLVEAVPQGLGMQTSPKVSPRISI